MKTMITALAAVLIAMPSVVSQAQSSDKILNELSARAKKYTSIYAEYSSRLIDKANDVDIEQSGKVYVKGDKYNVELGDYIMISDGETVWTYEKASNDCYVDYLEDVSEGAISPSSMFTIWEDGFKHEFKEEVKENGRVLFWINLYPEVPADQNFHTIQLYVDKEKMEVTKFIVKGRDGNDVIYKLDQFKPNGEVSEDHFKFSPKKYPGVNIIDNRI